MAGQFIDEESLQLIRKKIWDICKEKQITLEDIEDRTGFSYSQVYRIIRGKNNFSISGLIAVCRALEVQPKELFDFDICIPNYLPTRKMRKSNSGKT